MRESLSPVAFVATQMRRSRLQATAKSCSTNRYADAARAFWPDKTAENWAHRAGKSPRAAGYWLAARTPRGVSPEGQLAIRRELDRE